RRGDVAGGLAGSREAGPGHAGPLGGQLPGRPLSRVAIVTGGGTGIGRATALALHADGCSLVIAGRRQEPLDAVRQEIGADACASLAGDIRDPDVADALIDLALERF